MELKQINALVNDKKERKPPKPSYRSLFGVKDPSKKTKDTAKKSPRIGSKSKSGY